MSMSIGDYLNNSLQNTWTTSTGKPEEKDAAAGKTQQSAVSASLDQVNMGEDGVTIAQVSRQQGTEQSGSQARSAAPRTDTVEISAEGAAASAAAQDSTGLAEGYQYEEEDLSQYTDTELKQMYYRGEITLQEYEDETGETLE